MHYLKTNHSRPILQFFFIAFRRKELLGSVHKWSNTNFDSFRHVFSIVTLKLFYYCHRETVTSFMDDPILKPLIDLNHIQISHRLQEKTGSGHGWPLTNSFTLSSKVSTTAHSTTSHMDNSRKDEKWRHISHIVGIWVSMGL
jgi:hypothetical protein